MFWKFTLESSGLDTLLDKEDVTLLEVLDEEDVLQECKTPNEKLLDFLTLNETLKELLHLVVDKPSDDLEDSVKYKYMNIATEIIILDIDMILDKIASDEEYLDIVWAFVETIPPLNPLIASFLSKVMTMLVCRKSTQTFEYLKSRDAVNKLIVHIEISAIMELFIKMVTVVELPDVKMQVCKWLNEEQLIEKLIGYLHPSHDEQKHFYAGQLLSELVHIGRDGMSQFLDADEQNVENPLLLTLERRDIIDKLLTVIFDSPDEPNSDSSIINGIGVVSSLIEIRRPAIEGMEELMSPMDVDRVQQGCQTALDALATKLSHFHDVLVRPHPVVAMETTFGTLDPPLGKVRLSIAGLIAAAISSSSYIVNEAVAKTGTLNVLLDLFSRYEWNNFLHTNVQHCILAILSMEVLPPVNGESEETVEEKNSDTLVKHLFQECNVVQRCLNLWESNEISEKAGQPRKGYMGHLTKIMNQIKSSKEKGPNVETIQSMFNEFSDELREQWVGVCEGSLEELNKKNVCASMKSWFTPMDSDSEGDDFRHTTITQYDGTMQQAFENYQVKPMSNEFIETFGYDENSMQENENIKNPFDDVGKIDFSINANEESENEKLYNNIMEQKIRPFDDSSDSEEEDMWEEKELTFTQHVSQPRESTISNIRSDSESSSDEEKDLKVDSPDSALDIVFTETMDVDNEWTANFDAFGVSTTTTTATGSSDWPTPTEVVAPLSTNGEDFANFSNLSTNGEDFADFSDISKFEGSTCDPFQMETEFPKPASASPYEVRMEDGGNSRLSTCSGGGGALVTDAENGESIKKGSGIPPCGVSSTSDNITTTTVHVHVQSNSNMNTEQHTRTTGDLQHGKESDTNTRTTTTTTPTKAETPASVQVISDNDARTCKSEVVIAVNDSPSSTVVEKQLQQQQQQQLQQQQPVRVNGPVSPETDSSGDMGT